MEIKLAITAVTARGTMSAIIAGVIQAVKNKAGVYYPHEVNAHPRVRECRSMTPHSLELHVIADIKS